MDESSEWVKVGLAGEDGEVDVVAEAAEALAEHGVETQRHGYDLHVEAFDLVLSPRGIGIEEITDGGVRTVTIVRVSHPLLIPSGLFEYQHSVGEDARSALRSGFAQWAQIDLPVLCDLTRDKPEHCSMMEMTFPEEEGGQVRRLLFGPTAQMAQLPPPGDADQDEHPFCPCCLTTNCLEAFLPLIKSSETLGVRLYALRDANGEAGADCRVNGEDFPEGIAALRAYAETWPARGIEFRKQYVMFLTRLGTWCSRA